MARISMKEYYDNKDVATQIYDLKDKVADAVDKADTAYAQASSVSGIAEQANANASEALSKVSNAETMAKNASAKADNATAKAMEAEGKADDAVLKATDAVDKADSAKTAADTANATADSAKAIAQGAKTTADSAIDDIASLGNTVTTQGSDVAKLKTDVTGLKTKVSDNTDDIATQAGDIATLKATVGQLKISDKENTDAIAQAQADISVHATEITAIKAKDVAQDAKISANEATIDALTKELPTAITLYRDGTGKIRAQVEQEDSTTFDSNTLDMVIPYQYDIVSGTTERTFKLKVTYSNGSTSTTNDFVIPAGGGTDVSVTGITLTKSTTDTNKFKASIVLSDGTAIDSGYIEMVTGVSGTFVNDDLVINVNGTASVPIHIDTSGKTYTAGTGINIVGTTVSINGSVVALKSDIPDVTPYETSAHASATYATKTALTAVEDKIPDVSGYETASHASATYATKTALSNVEAKIPDVSGYATKTEVANTYATKTALAAVENKIPDVSGYATKSEVNTGLAAKADKTTVSQIQTAVGDCFNDVSVAGNVLTLTATDGQSNSVTLPSGATLTKIDLSAWPSDWRAGDIALVSIKMSCSGGTASSWTSALSSISISKTSAKSGYVCVPITADGTTGYVPFHMTSSSSYIEAGIITYIESASKWNTGTQIIRVNWSRFNGANRVGTQIDLTVGDNASDYIYEIYRLRA